jgi:ADP-heptose:LPS heptosyltransferase
LLQVIDDRNVISVRSKSLASFVWDAIRAVRRIRALNLDVVLDLELFSRVGAIFAGLSGAPIRVGFHRHTQEGLYRGDFMNRPVLYNPYQHISQQFVTLAEAIESADVPRVKREPAADARHVPPIVLRPGELESARRQLYEKNPSVEGRPLVFLCPGAGLLPIRAWPTEFFAVVARELIARGCTVAILGLPEDRELAVTIQRACGSPACLDLTGYTQSVREVTVLLHLGALLITNDGGTGHFASLTPVPAIVLFGPETPVLYGTLSTRAVNMFKGLSCSPCLTAYNHRRSPCDGNNVCLKSIMPAEVLAIADDLLRPALQLAAKPQPGERSRDDEEVQRRH